MSTSKVPMLPNEVLRQIIDDTMTDAYNDNIALLDSYVDHHVPRAEACLIDTYSTTMPDRQSRKNFATYFGDTGLSTLARSISLVPRSMADPSQRA